MPPTKGQTLRLERLSLRLTVTAVAAQIGVARQTVHAWENAERVPRDHVVAYRAAVKTLSDASESAA